MTPLDFKLWRVARRLSQANCARLFGVTQQNISHWERFALPADIAPRLAAVEDKLHERFYDLDA